MLVLEVLINWSYHKVLCEIGLMKRTCWWCYPKYFLSLQSGTCFSRGFPTSLDQHANVIPFSSSWSSSLIYFSALVLPILMVNQANLITEEKEGNLPIFSPYSIFLRIWRFFGELFRQLLWDNHTLIEEIPCDLKVSLDTSQHFSWKPKLDDRYLAVTLHYS